jgi:hypothetical protein
VNEKRLCFVFVMELGVGDAVYLGTTKEYCIGTRWNIENILFCGWRRFVEFVKGLVLNLYTVKQ